MTPLLPRLSTEHAIARMALFVGMDCEQIAKLVDSDVTSLPITYAATGGRKVDVNQLMDVRDAVRNIAKACGYPGRANLEGQQRFDRETGLLLRRRPEIHVGEALRGETWQFIAAGLLSDVVSWRWSSSERKGGDLSADRFLGGNRNCFGRLWLRATIFWDERLAEPTTPLNLLLEDNFTAILERSAFAAHRLPCQEVARAFLLRRPLVEDLGDSPAQSLLRDAMRRVIRTTGYSALWTVDEADLHRQIANLLDASLRAMSVVPVPEAQLVRRQPALALKNASGRTHAASVSPDLPPIGVLAEPESRFPTASTESLDDWATMTPSDRTDAVWRILIGQGEKLEYELVRIAAQKLRERGQIYFERLREGGTIFSSIQDAIERGVRLEKFDKPARGHRRAVAASLELIPVPVLTCVIRERLATGIPTQDATAVLVAHIRALVGLDQQSGAHAWVNELLEEMMARGEILDTHERLHATAESSLPDKPRSL